jgi:hypothetical protein
MLDVMELTLVERVLTVLESVLTVVCRPVTSVIKVPTLVLSVLTEALSVLTEEEIELTFVFTAPSEEVSDAADACSAVTSEFRVAKLAVNVATDLESPDVFEPMPVSAVMIEVRVDCWATPPLTVKVPMLEAANVGLVVLLTTSAPTR